MSFYNKFYYFFKNIRENLFRGRLTNEQIALIKNTRLFDSLNETPFSKLSKSITVRYCYSNELIFAEGSIGNALYIIEEGSVVVFTYNHTTNHKVYLARLDQGAFFGEQALLGQAHKSRNASIEAISPTKLIVISDKMISETLNLDTGLQNQMTKRGHEQLLHKIVETVPSYTSIKHNVNQHLDKYEIKTYRKNENVFYAKDPSDAVYIILEGSVRITIPQDKHSEITLVVGDLFGELGVIKQAPRAASATASMPTRLLCIPAKDFREIYGAHPEINRLVNTLQHTYKLPSRGNAVQFYGTVDNVKVITTRYKLANGRNVIASTSTNGNFIMNEQDENSSIKYEYNNNNLKITIGVVGDLIKLVTCNSPWIYLKNVCAFLLDQIPVSREQLAVFVNEGVFKSAELDQNQIVCICMSVSKDTITDLIESGVNSFAAISSKTGASTVCGSCKPRILAMLGQNVWMPAILKKNITHNENIASFTIELINGAFNTYIPGEHLVIQINIDGAWVERAYTISGVADNKYRITIKREEGGLLSEWLHKTDASSVQIHVSQPQGNYKLIIEDRAPIVCFAGGIGITPFVSFANDLKLKHKERPMNLIYIAPSKNDFIFLDEFDEIAKVMHNFRLTLWDRTKRGYLTDADVAAFINDYAGAEVYICGPEGFEESIIKNLHNIDFRKDKIFVEKFTYSNPNMPKKPDRNE